MNWPRLLDMVKLHEGFRATPYTDTRGVLTVGFGTNLQSGLTTEEAAAVMEVRLRRLEREVSQRLNRWPQLDDARREVLVEMAYQLGIGGLFNFKRMLAAVEAGDYAQAAVEILDSDGARQVPGRFAGYAERMRTGMVA